jgi:glycerol-3-phosphate O-acyltransferase/dihydroxyacetone phosphate acyltransferase
VVGKHHLDQVEQGPVIFVGNHANQFLDPAILVATVSRPVGFLVAAVSMTRFLIGHAARLLNSIPVVRSQDLARTAVGTVSTVTAEPLRLIGNGTKFLTQVQIGEQIKAKKQKQTKQICLFSQFVQVSGQQTTPVVASVLSDTELLLKYAFDEPVVEAKFKVWPKLDHAQVYEKVQKNIVLFCFVLFCNV